MASLSALETLCRACLRESLESYFEINKQCYFSVEDQTFGDVFNFCTHLAVKINDALPQRICTLCAQELQNTYEFLQKVLSTNKKIVNLKECVNVNKNIFDDNYSIKDPLEYDTDIEYTSDNCNRSEVIEETNIDDDEYNTADFIKNSQVSDDLISPLPSDSDDKNDGNFFVSVDSQIFPKGRLKCEICHKTYFTSAGLQTHMDIHLPKRTIVSKTSVGAGKYIKTNKKIKSNISDFENSNDHKINVTKDENKAKKLKTKKMFPCEVCGKQMISASKLRYHMVMHTGEKDYLCTICPKAYSTIYALKHHMRAHTGERPYECKFCGDRFLRPTTLKSHMRRHTGERPYGCDICGKRFIQHSSMATHMKLNHMDKTIPCPYCDKKYARQTDLNTHLLSHSGGKPFSCQLCPSRFTRQSNLNKHINQHHSDVNLDDKKSKNKTVYEAASYEFVQQKTISDLSAGSLLEKSSCVSNVN